MDRIAQEALGDWEAVLTPMLNPVQELADRCENYEEFQLGLGELAEEMDATELVNALSQTCFKARGLGDLED